jgi:hypothetical protein
MPNRVKTRPVGVKLATARQMKRYDEPHAAMTVKKANHVRRSFPTASAALDGADVGVDERDHGER